MVTNVSVPWEIEKHFEKNSIIVIRQDFNNFYFGKDYKWCLAFYKLCAFLASVGKLMAIAEIFVNLGRSNIKNKH